MIGFPKTGHLYSEPYLEWVRTQNCAMCGQPPTSEAHHHPAKKMGNALTDDLKVVPVCRTCHKRAHGERVQTAYGLAMPIAPKEVTAAVDATWRRFWYDAPREVLAAVLSDLYAWREKRGA